MTARFVYFIAAVLVFVIEIVIAVGSPSESFIRGSVGDILVIVLIYCLLRTAPGFPPIKAAVSTVAFAFFLEILQYIKIADLLRLKPGSIFYVIIGNTFSPQDLLMYLLGGVLSLTADRHILTPLRSRLTHSNR
jgi:Protein of unknown function (DUF2809)